MEQAVSLIGFGEAGYSFAIAGAWGARAHVFDRKIVSASDHDAMLASCKAANVLSADCLEEALRGANLILSVVTADQALAAAEAAAECVAAGALYCDLNSVAPQTKQACARLIEGAGAHYVDVAVMAPVDPAQLEVPLLLSGARADEAATRLAALGFGNIRVVGVAVGRASAIKMIRSVMVKGLEALTAECVLAAQAAGVLDEVFASLDASEKGKPWAARADYILDRMLVHGVRRAAEMEEVVTTLESLGAGAAMAGATVEWQRAIGMLGIKAPPEGLGAKIDRITPAQNGRAEAA